MCVGLPSFSYSYKAIWMCRKASGKLFKNKYDCPQLRVGQQQMVRNFLAQHLRLLKMRNRTIEIAAVVTDVSQQAMRSGLPVEVVYFFGDTQCPAGVKGAFFGFKIAISASERIEGFNRRRVRQFKPS